MKKVVLYARVSTLDQRTDRQKVNEKDYSMVIEDFCSGAIPFFDRDGGKKILSLIEKDAIKELAVWSIDRLGRDMRNVINTIHFFTEKAIGINFISQGLKTIDPDGRENPISKLIISILAVISEMEKTQILERQREGIVIAKLKGKYLGRKEGTVEDTLKFLSKGKNKLALSYLKKGYSNVDVSKLSGVNKNTVTKIKRLGLNV